MTSILVTGCNRGLGLGIVKQLLSSNEPIKYVFATCRQPEKAKELNDLKAKHSNLHVFALDVTDYASFNGFAKQIDDIVKDEGLNVLLNNAGVYLEKGKPEATKDDMINTFEINSVAPIMLTRAFIPLLKKAAARNSAQPLGVKRAAIVNMSSLMGSIADASTGSYAYRMSKAALNMATKLMSNELKDDGVVSIVLHPGWVQTDMGGPNGTLNTETSCSQMVQTILGLNASSRGKFLRYDGSELPW